MTDPAVYVYTINLEVKVLAGEHPWETIAEALRAKVSRMRSPKILSVDLDTTRDVDDD